MSLVMLSYPKQLWYNNKENIKGLEYKKNIRFDSITAEETNITNEEKALCAEWQKANFSYADNKFPFTFKIDGEEFNPDEWERLTF